MANGKMSSPAASLSPVSDGGSSPAILTPSRRVKAILAQFDDSDSEDEAAHPKNVRPTEHLSPVQSAGGLLASTRSGSERRSLDEDDEEDILPNAPRGHLAARLQARKTEDGDSDSEAGGGGSAYDRIKNQMQSLEAKTGDTSEVTNALEQLSSEDELAETFPRRKFLKRKSRSTADDLQHVTPSKSPSPLFFPSPSAAKKYDDSPHSDSHSEMDELTVNPLTNKSRFLELVEKHRKQRLAQEAADIAKRAARIEQLKSAGENSGRQRGSSLVGDSDEDSDLSNHGASRKLSKASRPTRKASKKAIEEMNRETQRMTRNMQLAHQAKIKKKITKESLLARFNFPLPGVNKMVADEDHTNAGIASSASTSDVEGAKKQDTPPTSPLLPESGNKDMSLMNLPPAEIFDSTVLVHEDAEELSPMEGILTQAAHSVDKGKERAVEEQPKETSESIPIQKARKGPRPIRVKWSKEDAVIARAADSDSDLEIVTSQSNSRKLAVFERLPSRKARGKSSHLTLRSLAHITDTTDKKRSSMNAAQMEADLRKAARMQARKERQEKIEELKAKGVIIQSAEERERDQQEVEDLVERARQEAAEIQKKEKAIAKKDGTFVDDGLDDDDSDDEEDCNFQDEDDAQIEIADDEEGEEDGDEEGEEEGEREEEEEGDIALGGDAEGLIDVEADEQGSDEESAEDVNELEAFINDAAGEFFDVEDRRRRSRDTRILSDDEDEEPTNKRDEEASLPACAKTPQSVPRSARKIIPGLQMSDDLPMGLTQAFAATLADSQSQDTTSQLHEQQSLAGTCQLPSVSFPIVPNLHRLESLDVVTDSQPASQTQPLDVDLSFSQSQQVSQSPIGVTSTQFSQMPFEPTQDVGFVLSPFTENRFDTPLQNNAPHSTIETVVLAQENEQSPILQRKGRLRRGRAATMSDDDTGEVGKDISAFDVMRHAAAREEAAPVFDKTKSHAKDIVDEAAEESEDEYAGLGGASDDEVGEEDEEDKKMIDHDEKVGQGDEAKLAGLFA
jgi:mediator of replication checkpoint protein 1